MKIKNRSLQGFTLIELLVVITIIAILAGIALPVFSSVQIKGAQTKALSNAKQIGLALRLYASDNNGNYPSYTVPVAATPVNVSSSNEAFAQLFPDYIKSEQIFWLAKSAFCSNTPPDDRMDTDNTTAKNSLTLASHENEWAYVLGLNDTSNPSVPLIADGFADASAHTYSKDQTQQGGVWKGTVTIVIRADSSGALVKLNSTTLTATGPNGGTTPGDIFSTSNGSNGWLGTSNTVVNPN